MGPTVKRPLYLLVALLALAAVIAAVLIVGVSSPSEEPRLDPAAGAGAAGEAEDRPARARSVRAAETREVAVPGTSLRPARPVPSGGSAPAPRVAPPPSRATPGAPGGPAPAPPAAPPELSLQGVSTALRAAEPAVERCYEQGRERNPDLNGRAVFRFTVVARGGRGRIEDAALQRSDLSDPAVDRCLQGALQGVTFEAPGLEGSKTIDFPILLGPVGRRQH